MRRFAMASRILVVTLACDAATAEEPVVRLGAPPIVFEIAAEDRDAFGESVDGMVGAIAKGRKGEETLDDASHRRIREQLHVMNVDVESFMIRGSKNYDFPKMLFYNDFFKKPLHDANPTNVWRKLAKKVPEASNVGEDQNVPNSSFFTNTMIESYTPERIAEEFLQFQPQGRMEVTKVKSDGTSEGLWIKDERGVKYILVLDSPFAPEMTTSAEYVGSTLARLIGYHVPKTTICHIDGTGDPLFDGRRAVATVAVPDYKGGWRYADFRHRREIRALQLLGAWIGNVDQTEQNTGLSIDENGVHRHYVWDFGASLGSFTFRPQIARMGWTKLFDPYQQFTQPLYDRGIRKVPWEAPYSVHSAAVGYFTAHFDPDTWQPFYTNMGFVEITEADRVWAAKRIARVTDEQIWSVVGLAGYTHRSDAEHVAKTLIARRDVIVRRYLGR